MKIYLDDVLFYFPDVIRTKIQDAIIQNKLEESLIEIRIRVEKKIILKTRDRDYFVNIVVSVDNILRIVEKLCENSVYAYKHQICEGFITVKGGHRIGITGTVVTDDEKIINVKYINSLNFRIAREIIGCSNNVIKKIIDIKNNTIFNTIIVSPPGKGKTTMLRDIIRSISNGSKELIISGKTCGVVDERGEIAACFHGIPQNDVGIRTDVIEDVCKAKGMKMLIRSMAPEVIACDEIGGKEDVEAIKYALLSGVKGVFTMHGKSIEDVKKNMYVNDLIKNGQIEKIIFLNGSNS